MSSVRIYRHLACDQVTIEGLWLEFGVAGGASAIDLLDHPACNWLYGFDTFTGLPEEWRDGYPAGKFGRQGRPPNVSGMTPVTGMIQDTLPPFLLKHPEPCAMVHIDTDIYSAAQFILRTLREAGRLIEGTIVMFDELAGYAEWLDHEWKAASEELFPFWHCVPVAAYTNDKGYVRVAYRLYNR